MAAIVKPAAIVATYAANQDVLRAALNRGKDAISQRVARWLNDSVAQITGAQRLTFSIGRQRV